MAKAPARLKPPAGLGTAGKALWKSILSDLDAEWELDARELHLLGEACRTADELADLQAALDKDGLTTTGSRGQTVVHPAVGEVRQLRIVLLRCLSAIEMVDPQAAIRSATPASARGRKAAQARWAKQAG